MTRESDKAKPLPNTSGEASDQVTETNENMEREFEKGERDEVPKANRPGGLRGNPS
jgi:hypothetical protein